MSKKRIFYFEGNTDGTVGGSYLLMFDLVNGLDRSKYEPIVGFYTDNYLVDRLRSSQIPVHLFDKPKPFSFGSRELDVVLMPIKKLVNFWRGGYLQAVKFRKFLRDEQIDLVNVNNSIRSNHPWMIAAKLQGIPCITHEMGINEKFTLIAKFLGKRLDAIICLSYCIHDAMKKAGADFNNIKVVHCGIDLDRYRIQESPKVLRERYGIPDGAPVVGVVGNVKWWKGQKTIVSAMPELVKKYPDMVCMLVGDMPDYAAEYHAQLRQIVSDNNLENHVIFTGFQKNSIDFMNLMDVVVHTSVDPEPFGIVTLEAMSLGKPLISTTIGGPAEVVDNGKSGLLIDPGKPDLLVGAIDRLFSDKELAQKLGDAGYQNLIKNFTFEKSLRSTMAIYEQIFDS